MAAPLIAAVPALHPAGAHEVCRFAGSTDFNGQVAAITDVAAAGSATRVDVRLAFEGRAMIWFRIRYLVEEISFWRNNTLESVAVNTRYFVNDRVVRQQWDVFDRTPGGFQAYRVQGKTAADFRRHHPGFAAHWDPSSFGLPWLQDYRAAAPERRADLDLAASPLPGRLRSPLAMAFYWVRFLPQGGQDMTVFLPGFKHDRLVDVSAAGAAWAGGMRWQASLRYPALRAERASTAIAWTSADRHLLQLAFDLHGLHRSAQGMVRAEGCQGTP